MRPIDKELRAIFDEERRGVDVPASLVDTLRPRAARRRVARYGAATVGALATAGLAVTLPLGLSRLGAPVAPGDTIAPPAPLSVQCGDPVPKSLLEPGDHDLLFTTLDGYSVSVLSPGIVSWSDPSADDARTYVEYDARYSAVVIARDRVVVGWTGGPTSADYRISGGEYWPDTALYRKYATNVVYACPDARDDGTDRNALARGYKYDVYRVGDAQNP